MQIELNISYDIDDASKEDGEVAAELIRDEAVAFGETVRTRLEAAGLTISAMRVNEDHES